MGYLFICMSVFANSVKGFCSKKISTQISTVRDCASFNSVRMGLCAVISLGYGWFISGTALFVLNPVQMLICAVSGVMLAMNVVCWTIAIKTDAYMLVSATSSAGFVIPCLFGIFLLDEIFTYTKLLSFIFIIAAMYFMLRYNISIKHKPTKKEALLLLLIFLSQGLNQAMQKLYTAYLPEFEVSAYTLYSFVFAELALLVCLVFSRKSRENTKVYLKENIPVIVTMSVAIFLVTYFQSLATVTVDAIVMYPLVNALSLFAGSLMASLFFKEKMRRDSVIGVLLVFIAIVLQKL